jgi:hypothetical protein
MTCLLKERELKAALHWSTRRAKGSPPKKKHYVEKKESLLKAPEVVFAEGKGGEVDEGVDEWEPGMLITSPCDSVSVSEGCAQKAGVNKRSNAHTAGGRGGWFSPFHLIAWFWNGRSTQHSPWVFMPTRCTAKNFQYSTLHNIIILTGEDNYSQDQFMLIHVQLKGFFFGSLPIIAGWSQAN